MVKIDDVRRTFIRGYCASHPTLTREDAYRVWSHWLYDHDREIKQGAWALGRISKTDHNPYTDGEA